MPLKSYRPITPSLRQLTRLVKSEVTKNKPEKSLIVSKKGSVGRSGGRVSVRHRQAGVKKYYRIIDFKRDKQNIPAKVVAIEYDPNRGPNVALLSYADGEKRYILAPEGLAVGAVVVSAEKAEPEIGNAMQLMNIPLGVAIHNIELNPGRGGQMVRGAGLGARLLAKEERYVNIKLPSGETRKVLGVCYATIGVLGNADLRHVNIGKAGRNRKLGWRPQVRGVAMPDPGKHPHAGSYKTTGIGMPSPKSPWGWKTRGKKTRRRTHTSKFILGKGKGR
ncbi:MAG: 50S ribosomal protein L2 [candidate division WWE3 bacterium GW2011_GWA1_46_21]|uniref:50S ribosomal protein L2 n=4 Tax=Katanobacteria TaxID=422282 RepID=A0A0G1RQD7_UNCKA|nr:MAG: 50S ribosomal protein L2 [candidate division WWE3 bacterium GW2011_GWA1_46_21]KKU48346.1 MAG: 50S ribosomal protein L2 [candidate division WWE3 bacterium GW2011_GWA2_46_9]KKU51334.1 MAG: 50S ribosomal protein L2 [candidate division WWE3 bacterium GW2011_GWC1_47_10]KKU58118.1 MAG: 50S ribosomal protein L2 [candidate division WWE3 bacterium GW2011_GWB1_47_11]